MRNPFEFPDEGILQGRKNETFELFKAWAGSTLAFAIYRVRGQIFSGFFLEQLLLAAIVCGLAFVLHELAHRVVARHYRAEAHFAANDGMLLLSIVAAFFSFFFAAPGAVWHRGFLTTRQGGLIALAGPVTNLALSLVFFIALLMLRPLGIDPFSWVVGLCAVGYKFNAFLGLFNMIPVAPFDGAKVLKWSPLVFGITVAVGLIFTFAL